ncbi:hypothetical protein MAXJ12_08624 [Mesorhizobium alhagi CCNWXJ12-2]|uniref:Uncharacterized protein n=1 Tax=Mesorhizobium alhagi CCNWXJ12-2 TaxID=1107882 RepID=H0HNK2_9HYPH|nr:hypothetical protein MAXJ12_08624 [Mesorhizobium alhagi CCNWXJ12-2]
MWKGWPQSQLPDSRAAAETVFDRLTPDEQATASLCAEAFCRLRALRGKPAHMLPYLRLKQFRELDGAPPFDKDGDFIITPDRPEWSAWLADLKKRRDLTPAAVERAVSLRKFLRKTRWPEHIQQQGGPA